MSQTAPPDRDTDPGDTRPDGEATDKSPARDWKASVAAVTATVTSAAVEAVTVVGDAARSLGSRSRNGDTSPAGRGTNGRAGDEHDDAPAADATNGRGAALAERTSALKSTASARTAAFREGTAARTSALKDRLARPRARDDAPAPPPAPAPAPPTNGATPGTADDTRQWAFRKGTDAREPAWLPPLRQRPVPERERPWLVRAATLALATLAGLAALTVVAVALVPRALALAADSTDAQLILPADTEFDPLASRSRVLYADGSLLAILHGEQDRNPVSLDKMPDHAWQAIVSAEDRKFREHDGYDPTGIGRALVRNFRAGSVEEGGSTITQQVARMNFEEVGADESVERKLKEVVYAMALERKFSKDEILERYVNQVYFGAGTYGLQAASEEFFDANVRDITPDQAALLAGLISSPSAYNPRENPEAAERQRDAVLASMARDGFLSESEAAEYASKPVKIAKPSDGTNKQPSIIEAVISEFTSNPLFGATEAERKDALFNGGLRIRTTIHPRLQKLAEEIVGENFGNDGPTAAIASVNPRNGRIIAASSSKKNNRDNFSLALQGRRQPGSAFKPFVMAEALRQGFSPSTKLSAKSPLLIPQPGPDWDVQNYGGASYGTIDMRTATAQSVNTYYAQLIGLVGVDNTVELVEDMGVSPAAFGEKGAFPAMVLGGLGRGTTPLEMASAYGTFAYNGVHVEPHLLREVKRGKEVLLDDDAQKTRVLEPGVNAVALDIMRGPVSPGGTASVHVPNFPLIGKTGTTTDSTDAWFVGSTPIVSTAVWVGHPKGQVSMPGATGGGTAAPIWQAYMSEALEGRDSRDFPESDEAEFVGESVKVPNVTGKSEQEAMTRLAKVKLIGQVQRQPHATVPPGVVIWASPSDEAPKGTTVYLGVSTGPAPPENDDDDDDDEEGPDLGEEIREQLDDLAGGGNGNGGDGNGNGGGGNGNDGGGNGDGGGD